MQYDPMSNNSYEPPRNDPYGNSSPYPAAYDLRAALGSGLFLAMCIIMSVSLAAGIFGGLLSLADPTDQSFGFDIFSLLITIGMWIAYGSARSYEGVKPAGISLISGTLKALKIVIWVVCGIVAVCAVIVAVSGFVPTALIDAADIDSLMQYLTENGLGAYGFEVPAAEALVAILPIVMLIVAVVMLLAAVLLMLYNLLFVKRIHEFVKSVSLYAGDHVTEIKHASSSAVWLLVLAILGLVSMSFSLFSLLSFDGFGVINVALPCLRYIVMILAYSLIRKYFSEQPASY